MRIYKFKDVVGNTTSLRLIQGSLKRHAFPKVSLFKGLPGTGKSTSAEIVGLSLTCLNPVDGEPCLECEHCKRNLKALKTTGESTNLIKKNLGKLNSRKDVLTMIQEIFVLQSAMGNNVYILEEAHTLKPDDQTALLEEIDRLDENTYIIICTTEAHKILPALRSRAMKFDFSRLNQTESHLLFARTCQKLGVQKTSKEVENMVIRYSKGIPRDMVNLIDFIHNARPTEKDVADFLGFISSEDFSEMFLAMSLSLKDANISINNLLLNHTYDVVLNQLKDYVINVMFYVTAGIKDDLTRNDTRILDDIMTGSKIKKICKILEDVTIYNTSEIDFKYKLARITWIMNDKTLQDVYRESSKEASKQSYESKELYEENTKAQTHAHEEIKKIDKTTMMDYFKTK